MRVSFPVSRQMQMSESGDSLPDASALPRQLSNLPEIEICPLRFRVMGLPDSARHTGVHCSCLSSCHSSLPILSAPSAAHLPSLGLPPASGPPTRSLACRFRPLPRDNRLLRGVALWRRPMLSRLMHVRLRFAAAFEALHVLAPATSSRAGSCPFIRRHRPAAPGMQISAIRISACVCFHAQMRARCTHSGQGDTHRATTRADPAAVRVPSHASIHSLYRAAPRSPLGPARSQVQQRWADSRSAAISPLRLPGSKSPRVAIASHRLIGG
ncbi:hypothetical protein C8Q76DRAFT_792358 [Earliella scabrosa]|nr:hypothetical protein C8Q76DRAFT_792358 [Earliella scabrosa]